MVYLDTSALLKLLWTEPESAAVRGCVVAEDLVVVSTLAELEITRLVTYDTTQAVVARALGIEVVAPTSP